jgi:hypothetical protein
VHFKFSCEEATSASIHISAKQYSKAVQQQKRNNETGLMPDMA